MAKKLTVNDKMYATLPGLGRVYIGTRGQIADYIGKTREDAGRLRSSYSGEEKRAETRKSRVNKAALGLMRDFNISDKQATPTKKAKPKTKIQNKNRNKKGRISNTIKKYIDEAVLAGIEAGQQLIQAPIDELPLLVDNYIPAQVMPSAYDVAQAQALPELPLLYPVQTGDVFNGYQSEPDVYAKGGYLMYNPFYIG